MTIRHDHTANPRTPLWGTTHTTGDEAEGDILQYVSGEWVAVEGDFGREVVMVTASAPPDPVINSDGDDWVYGN